MGYWKNYLIEVSERGYADSNKYVCASHFGDSYLVNQIRYKHPNRIRGFCSFCDRKKGARTVIRFNDFMEMIMPVIRREYLPAIGNAIWDSEENEYYGEVFDPFIFVSEELNSFLCTESDGIINEIKGKYIHWMDSK